MLELNVGKDCQVVKCMSDAGGVVSILAILRYNGCRARGVCALESFSCYSFHSYSWASLVGNQPKIAPETVSGLSSFGFWLCITYNYMGVFKPSLCTEFLLTHVVLTRSHDVVILVGGKCCLDG